MTIRDQIEGQTTEVEPPESAYEQQPDANDSQPAGWLAILQSDTPEDQIHQRAITARGGQPVLSNGQPLMVSYVTARFVQDRLDAAVGPMNWQSTFESLPDGSVRCGIGIREPGAGDFGWVTKYDVGVPSNIEPQKGAHSDAFKRAGVQWGIARDLYDDRDEQVLYTPTAGPAQDGYAGGYGGGYVEQPRMDAPIGQGYGQPVMPQGAQPHEQTAQMQGQQMQMGQAWMCPIHNDTKVVPAGQSKKPPYRQYRAFYACPVAGCDQKGPSL